MRSNSGDHYPSTTFRWLSTRFRPTFSGSRPTMSLRTRLKSLSNIAFCCLKDCFPSYFHFANLTQRRTTESWIAICEYEDQPFGDVQHPREQLNEICSRSGRHGRAGAESVDFLDSLIVFIFEGGVIIDDRHGRGSCSSPKVFLQALGARQQSRSKKKTLLAKKRVITTDCRLSEDLMGSSPCAAPTMSEAF